MHPTHTDRHRPHLALLLLALACTSEPSATPADAPPPTTAAAPSPTATAPPAADTRPTDAHAIELTYIGNEGFAIRFHPTTADPVDVLVDAVLGKGLPEYPLPSPEIQRAIERGEPPFDRIALVLATHHHDDHFDAVAALRLLASQPAVELVTTEQAIERMRKSDPTAFAAARARLHGLRPTEDAPVEHTFGSITLHTFAMHHGRKRKPPVQNLGFVVSVDDQSFLHMGDTELSAQELAALPWMPGDVPIDVALVPYWLLLDADWEETLTQTVRPGHVVAMHLPRPDAPTAYFGEAGTLEELVRTLRDEPLPSLVLEQPGSRQIVTASPLSSSSPS